MAFENFDKQAVAEMAKAYDKSQQTKVGFWGGLFSLLETLSSSGNNSNTGSADNRRDEASINNFPPHISDMTLGPFAEHSPVFNPDTASGYRD